MMCLGAVQVQHSNVVMCCQSADKSGIADWLLCQYKLGKANLG